MVTYPACIPTKCYLKPAMLLTDLERRQSRR